MVEIIRNKLLTRALAPRKKIIHNVNFKQFYFFYILCSDVHASELYTLNLYSLKVSSFQGFKPECYTLTFRVKELPATPFTPRRDYLQIVFDLNLVWGQVIQFINMNFHWFPTWAKNLKCPLDAVTETQRTLISRNAKHYTK